MKAFFEPPSPNQTNIPDSPWAPNIAHIPRTDSTEGKERASEKVC